MTQRWYG